MIHVGLWDKCLAYSSIFQITLSDIASVYLLYHCFENIQVSVIGHCTVSYLDIDVVEKSNWSIYHTRYSTFAYLNILMYLFSTYSVLRIFL